MRFYVWISDKPEHAVTIEAPTAERARVLAAGTLQHAQPAHTLKAWPTSYGHPATVTRERKA